MAPRKYPTPKWLTPELLNYLLGKSRDNPSRNLYIANARRWREWYRGHLFLAPTKSHDDMTVPENDATARRNIIGETVDAASSIFLKNTPIIRRIPLQTRWAPLSDDIDAMWLWQWTEAFGQTVTRSMLEDAEITGLGAVKLYWEFQRSRRQFPGGIVIKSVPAEAIYVDPSCSADHRAWNASFIFEHMKRFPEEIIAKYGDEAAKILGWKAGDAGSQRPSMPRSVYENLGMSTEEVRRRVDGKNTGSRGFAPFVQSDDYSSDKGKVDLYEAWLFPDQLYGSELAGGDKVPEQYRFGLIATMVNDRIIRTRPNPNAKQMRVQIKNEFGQEERPTNWVGHGSHPYVFMHWRRVADKMGNRKFYDCMGMVEWMISMQFNVNAIRRNMARVVRSMGNPMIAYNEDALATPANQVVGAPGQMLKIRGRFRLDEAIRILDGAQMPPQAEMMVRSDIEGMKEAAGVQRGVTGLFPAPGGGTSHTSGEVIGPLQEASFGPLWKYVEHVGDALTDMATKMEGLMQQNFKAGHYIASSRRGQAAEVEWTGEHKIAQFRRIVIAGATTPIYDMQREQREGLVKQYADQAIQSGDPRMIRTTMIFLGHMNFPWTADYVQLLEEELARLQAQQEETTRLGAMAALGQFGGGANQLALPARSGEGVPQGAPGENLDGLAEAMGVSPEQLMAATIGK